MKPVTDPALLARLNGGAAAPSPASPSPTSGGTLPAASGGLSAPARPLPAPVEPDPAEGMPWYEKFAAGMGGSMRNMYLGAKDLVGQATPQDLEERQFWEKNKDKLGWVGSTGGIVGDLVSTLPLGGPVGTAGKVLTKAVPYVAKLAAKGGRIFNLGTAARAGTESAIASGVAGDSTDETTGDRLDNVLSGGATGFAIPGVLGAAGKVGGRILTELSPTAKAAGRRGYAALERTLGKDRLADITNQVENPMPSMLPRTTAAMAQEPRLGALERGARNRGNVDFAPHDRQVAEQSWDILKGATSAADDLPVLHKAPGEMMTQGKAIFDAMPLDRGMVQDVSQQLLAIRNTNEVIANPALAREIDTALAALDHPDATLGVLPQLVWSLGKDAGDSTAIAQAKGVLTKAVDDATGGQFTNLQTGFGVAKDQIKGAQAAADIRSKFVGPDGFPTTPKYYGDAGQSAIPALESAPLRRTIDQASQSGALKELPPADVEQMGRLADQLRQHEVYRPGMSSGSTNLALGEAEGAASAALNAGPLWRLRGALGSVFSNLNERSQKAVDQALLDPQAFLRMVEAKRALGRPLETWEKAVESTVRNLTRSAAISTGE